MFSCDGLVAVVMATCVVVVVVVVFRFLNVDESARSDVRRRVLTTPNDMRRVMAI